MKGNRITNQHVNQNIRARELNVCVRVYMCARDAIASPALRDQTRIQPRREE